jgi:hypothetical protein
MMRWIVIVVTVLLALPARPAAASGEAVAEEGPVHAGENGARYHRADCPRLHFGHALSRAAARAAALEPCPVCLPDAAAAPALPIVARAGVGPAPGVASLPVAASLAAARPRETVVSRPGPCPPQVADTRVCRAPTKGKPREGLSSRANVLVSVGFAFCAFIVYVLGQRPLLD